MEFLLILLVVFLLIYFFWKRILLWMIRRALHLPKQSLKTQREKAQSDSQSKSNEKVDPHEMVKRLFDKDQGEYVEFTEEQVDEEAGSFSKKS